MVLLLLSALIAGVEPMSLRPGATFAYEGLPLRAWGAADGLPQATVEEAVQTEDGFLWLAIYGGLVRFNGQHLWTGAADPQGGPARGSPLARGSLWMPLAG